LQHQHQAKCLVNLVFDFNADDAGLAFTQSLGVKTKEDPAVD
jgi:hypothetical protein